MLRTARRAALTLGLAAGFLLSLSPAQAGGSRSWADAATRQELARELGGWDVDWRKAGGGTLLARGRMPASGVAQQAEQFLAAQAARLGLQADELRSMGTRPGRGDRTSLLRADLPGAAGRRIAPGV